MNLDPQLFRTPGELHNLNRQLAGYSLAELLQWGLSTFDDRLVQVSSFAPPGMVILDHLARLQPGVKVIAIDTGFLLAVCIGKSVADACRSCSVARTVPAPIRSCWKTRSTRSWRA